MTPSGNNSPKFVIAIGSMLSNVYTGEHIVHYYYNDGSIETRYELLSPAFIPPIPIRTY